jgi:hypothetical protein
MRFLRAQIALELRSFSRYLRFLPGVMAIYGTLSRDNAPLNELNRYELNGPIRPARRQASHSVQI